MLSLAVLSSIIDIVTNTSSTLVLTLVHLYYLNIFLLDSASMKFFLAVCKVFEFTLTMSLVVAASNAGS